MNRNKKDMISQSAGFAVGDRKGSFLLNLRLEVAGGTIILIRAVPYGTKFRISQCHHLPSGQSGFCHSDVDTHAGAADIFIAEMTDFANAKAGGIERRGHSLLLEICHEGNESKNPDNPGKRGYRYSNF